DLQDGAEIHREAVAVRREARIREVGGGRDAERPEREGIPWYQLLRKIHALVQLDRAVNVGDAEAHLEPRVHLVSDGGLHVYRLDLGVVAEEASLEARRGPLGLEAVGHVQPDPHGDLRGHRARHNTTGDWHD